MGVVYNVPPLRAKEWPYVDVLVEALNNVIRLGLGWFAIVVTHVPPVSLLVAYWALGAFFMATKRLAEYRHIGDATLAGNYRRSFRFYTEDRLLVSLLLYASVSALFGGIFIVRYHLELILFAPLGLGLLAFYLHLGLLADSPAQRPEHLYRERAFSWYAVACVIAFVVLMFTSIPFLYGFLTQMYARFSLRQVGHRSGKTLRMCSCSIRSGAVVCRSVGGRLRGPLSWWGPARRQPDQTQAADSMSLTWRRTVKASRTRPRLSPTFYAGAEPSLTVQPPWNWQPHHDSAVCCGRTFREPCNSSPDTDGVLQPRKSLTMRGLSAIRPG